MQQRFLGKQKRGFTLIELLIVMAIMGILAAASFASYQSSKRSATLRAAQREVATVIRLAQGYALQGKTQTASGVEFTPCGYGFRFTAASSYQIFYTRNASGSCVDDDNYPGTEIMVGSAFVLDNGVVIDGTTPYANTKFYFKIPFGEILNSSGGVFSGTVITFSHPSAPSETISIAINAAGEVTEN